MAKSGTTAGQAAPWSDVPTRHLVERCGTTLGQADLWLHVPLTLMPPSPPYAPPHPIAPAPMRGI